MRAGKKAKPNSLEEWVPYIDTKRARSICLGYERMDRVAEETQLRVQKPFTILVGGTNGKGTTVRSLEALLLRMGYTVGSFYSPMLISYCEMICVNGTQIQEADFVQAIEHIDDASRRIWADEVEHPTIFEHLTLAALYHFSKTSLDVLLLELGMGGAGDAVNWVHANMSIVTNVAIDHTHYLGTTREAIGAKKAAIFRPGCIAIVAEDDPPNSILTHLQCHNIKPQMINRDWHYKINHTERSWSLVIGGLHYHDVPVPLSLPLESLQLAMAAVVASPLRNPTLEDLCDVALAPSLPGRYQTFKKSKSLIILDVAHNAHAAAWLGNKLKEDSRLKLPLAAIVGIMPDKDVKAILSAISDTIRVCHCCPIDTHRGVGSVTKLTAACRSLSISHCAYESVDSALTAALLAESPSILCFGSFNVVAACVKFLAIE